MERDANREDQTPNVITATEIACRVYSPKQWRLQYGLGLSPANRKDLAAGDRHHARKAVAERVAGGTITLGVGITFVGHATGTQLVSMVEDETTSPVPFHVRPRFTSRLVMVCHSALHRPCQ